MIKLEQYQFVLRNNDINVKMKNHYIVTIPGDKLDINSPRYGLNIATGVFLWITTTAQTNPQSMVLK